MESGEKRKYELQQLCEEYGIIGGSKMARKMWTGNVKSITEKIMPKIIFQSRPDG